MAIKVELNINNDAELRAHIKEVIKSQVVSIAREEVVAILAKILENKIPDVNPNEIVKQEVVKLIKSTIDNGRWDKPSFIQEEARKEIQKLVKEIISKNPIV